MIKNVWNPTHNEIRAWAFTGTSLPHPHWAITLIDFNNLPVLIELAGDDQCLNQSFFQKCLYTFTGQVMEKQNMHELVSLETTLEQMRTVTQPVPILEWIEFSHGVLNQEALDMPAWDIHWSANPVSHPFAGR